ncbi:MAG: polysaccharide deacetylase family protein [Candidatus Omnitrophica bacterium]|nr:polysaccharide deacetylase family protein [Candidatus Omnitrophota bacterium]
MSKHKKIIFGIIAVFLSLAAFVAAGGLFLSRQYAVPILMYHSVNPVSDKERNRLIVSPEIFERQMRFLKEHHYNVVSLDSLIPILEEKKKIPPKTVAITFDDGYKDNYIYAFPVLKKYQFSTTIFIIVSEVGRSLNDRLDWGQIKEMQDSGLVIIGSHAIGPDPLYKMKTEKELRRQIFDSKKILEEKLGREVLAFSYPEGMFDQHMKELVKGAGYKMAVATKPGKEFANDDLFALKRQRISTNSGDGIVLWAQASGYYHPSKGKKRNK